MMNYKKILTISILGSYCIYYASSNAISIATQNTQVSTPQVMAYQQIEQTPNLKELLHFFIKIQNNPTSVTKQKLTTLEQLINDTSTLQVTPQEQNIFRNNIVKIYENRAKLSNDGKQIFTVLSQLHDKIKFLSSAQIAYLTATMQPQIQTETQSILSYASDIAIIMGTKNARSAKAILPQFTKLLNDTKGNLVDTATKEAFSKAFDDIVKIKDKIQRKPKLQQEFAKFLYAAYLSNFTNEQKKSEINALYPTIIKSISTSIPNRN